MSDRTEAPTPRRLEDARSEGRVARSIELNSAVILLASLLLMRGPGKSLVDSIRALLVNTITHLPEGDLSLEWLRENTFADSLQVLPSLALILVGLLLVGSVTTLVQTGFMWTSKNVGFQFRRLNPLDGLKRIFSNRGLVELLRSLLKLVVVGWMVYSFLQSHTNDLLLLVQMDFVSAVNTWSDLAIAMGMRVAAAYFVLAALDYAYQRWDYIKTLRMTKEEIKEEIKRSEGDPFMKARIRGMMRRIARSRMFAKVPNATVVITNPTHFAVAIQYNPDQKNAPYLVAKGANLVAQRIIEIARRNNVPVVQNVPLARAIFHTVKLDQEIPVELYRAVAEVLAYVYRLRGQSAFTNSARI